MIWLVLACMFLEAGLSKLRFSGMHWLQAPGLERTLIKQHYFITPEEPLVPWGLWISQHSWACRLLGVITLFFEIGYPPGLVAGADFGEISDLPGAPARDDRQVARLLPFCDRPGW